MSIVFVLCLFVLITCGQNHSVRDIYPQYLFIEPEYLILDFEPIYKLISEPSPLDQFRYDSLYDFILFLEVSDKLCELIRMNETLDYNPPDEEIKQFCEMDEIDSESIFEAIETNNIRDVDYWIEKGHVNDHHGLYDAPLDHAVRYHNSVVIEHILRAGGRSTSILNPLMVALGDHMHDDTTVLELLFEHGYVTFDKDEDPIFNVALHGHINRLRWLLEHFELDVNHCDSILKRTGLFYAVRYHYGDVVHMLMEHGADPYKVMNIYVLYDTEGTILDYARDQDPKMYDIIVSYLDNIPE